MAQAFLPFPSIDPVAVTIGPFVVRWYALAYVVGLLFAALYMKRLVGNPSLWNGQEPSLSARQIDDLFLWAALGVVLGGRIGYVLFYDPAYFVANPMEALKPWRGGMSFHGGFLGVIVASLLYGRSIGVGADRILDLAAASVPVGLGLGRLANFINGELYGRPSDLPWAMVFPEGGSLPRHPSQLYEALLEGVVLFAVARIATHRHGALASPGRVAGLFALGYGLSRILIEFVREPDRQIGVAAGFLTRGMLLSLPMLAVGLWLLARSRRAQS